jgi:hypothetical protein
LRLIALLAWFEEPAEWLAELVASCARAGCDHVVAVDGAYALLPNGSGFSSPEQHAAILHTARGAGIGATIHAPSQRWFGNEVEKRSALFRLAEATAEPGDWYWVLDADCVVTEAHAVKERLADTTLLAAEHRLEERQDGTVSKSMHRGLFRAGWGLRVQGRHSHYVDAAGRVLWDGPGGDHVPALDLFDVRVEHRRSQRPVARRSDQVEYYRRRDLAGVERLSVHTQAFREGVDDRPDV